MTILYQEFWETRFRVGWPCMQGEGEQSCEVQTPVTRINSSDISIDPSLVIEVFAPGIN